MGAKFIRLSFVIISFLILGCQSTGLRTPAAQIDFSGNPPAWAYDAGPDLSTEMGRELIEINAETPYFPGVSKEIMGDQKFRPAFGPIPWRMLQKPNSVKILFIGQDGTHIAEAAGRPATAGFGGRAHDLANYFGVDYSAAFINTYAFTIRGQYGDRGVPFLYDNNGVKEIRFSGGRYPNGSYGSFMDNELWLMSQGQNSPITKWRNNLIDWIIRNNKESLKLIVTFGGSARDTVSSYIISKGGEVGARVSESEIAKMGFPEYKLAYAGGNNNFAVPIDKNGKDIYEQLLGRRPNYTPPFQGHGAPDDQQAVQNLLARDPDGSVNKMVFSKGGLKKSGMLNPAQLGGYSLRKIKINGEKTISLKGIPLKGGQRLNKDVLIVDLPHPTFLSMQSGGQASNLVGKKVKVLEPWVESGWKISPDEGQQGHFFSGRQYEYRRGDIGQEYYDFGTPGNRMVAKSDAKRLTPNIILLGARKDPYFDRHKSDPVLKNKFKKMTNAKPAKLPPADEMFIAASRSRQLRKDFDPGPSEIYAKLMKKSLNLKNIFTSKDGKVWANLNKSQRNNLWRNGGIKNFNVKNHPNVADFGHYRGKFTNAKVVILADPHGYDDIITARALTGSRGQYLHGLMKDMGIGENYLVLKTVPFGMDGASRDEWKIVLDQTRGYRSGVLKQLLGEGQTKLILTDGSSAAEEMRKFLATSVGLTFQQIPFLQIKRNPSASHASEMVAAGARIKQLAPFSDQTASGKRADIPSGHLSYYARVWEGTSGDRVMTSEGGSRGLAFAEVAPSWAYEQKVKLSPSSKADVSTMKKRLCTNRLPLPGERPSRFLSRSRDFGFPRCTSL